MKDLVIDYTIGNEVKQIKIDFMSNGTGQIMMEKYFHGQTVFALNEWRVYLNQKSVLNNSDDIQTLIQILNDCILTDI